MAYRPLPLKCWLAFLKYQGFEHTRTAGSHHQWTKKGHRTIAVWGNEKEIPAMHLKTSCKTMAVLWMSFIYGQTQIVNRASV